MNSSDFVNNLEQFSDRIYKELSKTVGLQNIIISPLSIQSSLTILRIGAATGQTALEMERGLRLISQNTAKLAKTNNSILAAYLKSNVLEITNEFIVMKNYEIQGIFKEMITKKFFSSIEEIDFIANKATVKNIFKWVDCNTCDIDKNKICHLLSDENRLVLQNFIHFKGNWVHQFEAESTQYEKFHMGEAKTIKVPMMSIEKEFKISNFPKLEADVLELPYRNCDFSMLIILPNSHIGLAAIEQKMRYVSLQDLRRCLHYTAAVVRMPKFKIEFEMELNDVLKKLGMHSMFSDNADFNNILKSKEPLKVSKIIHKAFIQVNEEGTEAYAATGITVTNHQSTTIDEGSSKAFNINRPFLYFILNAKGYVFFKGNVNKF